MKLKKLASLLLALVMVFALATTALADDTTLVDISSHTFTAYQILSATSISGDGKLGNLSWGSNITTDNAKANLLGSYANIAELAEALNQAGNNSEAAKAFAKTAYANVSGDGITVMSGKTVLGLGYYLIVDTTTIGTNEDYFVYNLSILRVSDGTQPVEIVSKVEAPTLEKKIIKDTDNNVSADGKTDNIDIGDTVTFELTGTVPASAVEYDYYYYIIGDKLDDGLTFSKDTAEITVSASTTGTLVEDTDYAVYVGEDGYTFQIAFLNAKALAGQTITVTYKATLNEQANIGEVPNVNTVELTYSNKPDATYGGTNDTDKPGKPDSTKVVPLGTTPESKTETYTTGIQINKVDEDGNPLAGAAFKITGDNINIVLVSQEEFIEDTDGTYYKLKNGTYTEQVPQTEDKYEQAPEGATAGYVYESGTYREATEEDILKGVTLYILVSANVDKYESPTTYKKNVTYKVVETQNGISAEANVGDDGVLIFEGLGKGTYTITETQTPNGYNTISDITVWIDFNAATTPKWSATASNTSGSLSMNEDGVFELTIENKSGTTLPSTGGMGTTIFYVLGGILVVGAVVLLVTKKRMSAEK